MAQPDKNVALSPRSMATSKTFVDAVAKRRLLKKYEMHNTTFLQQAEVWTGEVHVVKLKNVL